MKTSLTDLVHPPVNQKPPIKILYLITRLVPGGAAKIVQALCNYINRDKYDVTLAYGTDEVPEDKGISSQVTMRTLSSLTRAINPLKDIQALIKAFRFIKKGRYDIVHTHTSKAGMVGRWAARLARVPCLIHSPHGHIFASHAQIPGVPRWIRGPLLFIERTAARFTDRIITPTHMEKEEELALGIGRPGQFRVVSNGIDFEETIDISNGKTVKGTPIIATAGRLAKEKGLQYLIEAMPYLVKEFPQAQLFIMGEGPLRNELEALVKRHNLNDHVTFLGFLEDIKPVLLRADVFVLPSLYEAFGLVLVEAMSLKKLVIATRVGSISEVVRDGETGILVEPANPMALAEAIKKGLKDSSLRQRLVNAAYNYARKHFDIRQTVARTESVYQELLKKPNCCVSV